MESFLIAGRVEIIYFFIENSKRYDQDFFV